MPSPMNRASVMHVTKIGTLLAVFVAYTAAIAVSSVGSDCDINDYAYDDNSNSSIKVGLWPLVQWCT